MHHFGEKTKINLDFGRFCIIFVFGLESVWQVLKGERQKGKHLCTSIKKSNFAG